MSCLLEREYVHHKKLVVKRERGQKLIFLMNLLDERVKYLNKNALYFLGSKQPLTITLSVRKPI